MKNDWVLYNGILSSSDEYPPEFVDLVISEISRSQDFCDGILKINPQFPYAIAPYIARALEKGHEKTAASMFASAIENADEKSKDLENLIDSIISSCSNWDELETMEAFKFNILPIIQKIDDKRIHRLLPKFIEAIDSYIRSVESSEEKYQYSRRFAWRKNCVNGSEYGIDPLDYETENEYNAAVFEEKYAWRKWHSHDAKQFEIDPTAFENEDDFVATIETVRMRRMEQRESTQHQRTEKIQVEEPLADSDKTIYTFCGVTFPYGNTIYHYLTNDDTLAIGDMVVVPVGPDEKETVAEIVTVQKHLGKTAPYPVYKAKHIIGRYIPNEE